MRRWDITANQENEKVCINRPNTYDSGYGFLRM